MATDTDRVFITAAEALAMLPDGAKVHTFRNPLGGIMLGADWSRKDIVEAMKAAWKLELAGPMATGMNHGLVLWASREASALYVETKKGRKGEAP